MRKPHVRLNDAEVRSLYDAGLNDAEIARTIGATSAAVCYWRKQRGLPKIASASADNEARILKLRENGKKFTEIASQLGLTKGIVAGVIYRKHTTPASSRVRQEAGV